MDKIFYNHKPRNKLNIFYIGGIVVIDNVDNSVNFSIVFVTWNAASHTSAEKPQTKINSLRNNLTMDI